MGKYFDVIGIIKNGKLPPMNENQWSEIPLLLSRCYFKLQLYAKTYNIMKNSKTSILRDRDILSFIISAISVKDINSAQEYSKLLEKRKAPDKELYAESLYHIGEYFKDAIFLDKKVIHKGFILEIYLKKYKISKDEIIMIGDRSSDRDAAEFVGCDFLGILYGHGKREELEGAKFFAESPGDILKILDS